jgi:hypothetical protein
VGTDGDEFVSPWNKKNEAGEKEKEKEQQRHERACQRANRHRLKKERQDEPSALGKGSAI